jgi:hydrogenase 3 maturation protease
MDAGESPLTHLNKLRGSDTVIVGIGNTLKADDAAGPLVCKKLRQAKSSAEPIDTGTVPENYIQPIIKKKPHNLVVIDAIDFGGSPGQIKIFRPEQLSSIVISTHTLSPRVFIDMIRAELDIDVYFIGIQPVQTALGQPISEQVSLAVQQLSEGLIELFPPPE